MMEKGDKNFNSEILEVQLRPQTQTTSISVQSHIQDRVPKFEAPVINISVKVPPYKGNHVTLHLPKIQPVIHLHFDEIAKMLQIREEENVEAAYQVFQNLLSMTSPKFGDLKVLFDNDSVQEENIESEIVKTKSCSSEKCFVDENLNTAAKMSSNVSIESEIVNVNKFNLSSLNTVKKTDDERNKNRVKRKTFEEYFKLKRGVVLLRDVRKSKYFKNVVAAGKLNDITLQIKEKETQNADSLVGKNCSENENFEMCRIKVETESSTCKSPRENLTIVDTSSPQVGGVGHEDNFEVSDVNKTLTALAEGCNFSEILRRFKLKPNLQLVDSGNNLETTTEPGICIKEEIIENDTHIEEPVDGLGAVTENLYNGKNCTDESGPCSVDIVQESVIEETSKEAGLNKSQDCDNPLQLNDSCDLNSNTDSDNGNVVTTEEESSLLDIRVTENSEISCISANNPPLLLSSNTLPQNNSVDPIQLKLIQKRMNNRTKSNSAIETIKTKLPKRESPLSEASSSPKKMKGRKSQKKMQTSSGLEEYIPLQASGPTKFAVAPLNKVTPYKTHDAKNFKSNMLFGNRVARFSNSNVLKTYLLKKNAYKNQSS